MAITPPQITKMNQSNISAIIARKIWDYAHVLKDDGLAFMDYTEQITYLIFLKMASEQHKISHRIPPRHSWDTLARNTDTPSLLQRYHQSLRKLSEEPGLVGLIFSKPQSKINDPAKLRRLIRLIDSEHWSGLDVDVKGEIYEGLLARNAAEVRGGAGQYFTPRPIIRAVVEVMKPTLDMTILDPACGTGGFLIGALEFLKRTVKGPARGAALRKASLRGVDLVPNVARLCAMNLFLHGVGESHLRLAVDVADSLASAIHPVDMVLTNPPFGRRSSYTIVSSVGRRKEETVSYIREDFWATTSNKQLNFIQHVYSSLRPGGKAAVVVPDNVLFEGGVGETIRRALLDTCRVHTLLRLPTGIWYSPSVNANVLFFEKGCRGGVPCTDNLWVYDLRRMGDFSLRRNPIRSEHLADFVDSYRAENLADREESDVFRRYGYEEIVARDQASLDFRWSIGSTERFSYEDPHVLMQEIVSEMTEAVREFSAVEDDIRGQWDGRW